ncbi:MAG: glycosyltransferase family 4 protein [Sulfurimonadaceae bacterium]|jgi:glycosyltransferase involved in cell wall biosynthesis|nr:glycosyltransferase family 4 protein [Sulfurimonadaceae bacterium]
MKKILFFGELAPNIIHGISLANRLNIDLLSKKYFLDIVEEKSELKEHNKRTSSKIIKIWSYIKEIYNLNKKKKYDFFYTIFSLSTFGSIKTLFSILSFKMSNKRKVVIHIHRGDFEIFYNKNLLNKYIVKIIFKLIDKLIVLSENQKIQFSEHLDISKIFILENSLIEEFQMVDGEKEEQFIYISNYIKEKGIFELLEVFSNDKNLSLKCFGGFVNNEDEIRKYESKNIKISSFINGKEKFQEIDKSQALILPSWNEGQPTVILEAMMMGTIVITTKVGLIEELLGEDYPFYFKAKNQKSLKECINRFQRYENKDELSYKLRQIYKSKYSKEIHQQKLLKIFGE